MNIELGISFLQRMDLIRSIFIVVILLLSQGLYASEEDPIQEKIEYYLAQAKLDSAKIFINEQLNDPRQSENFNSLSYQLVKVLFIQSEYNEALRLAFKSIDQIEDQEESSKFNFLIGCIYSAITDFDKSVEYLDKVAISSRDTSLKVKSYLLLSDLHFSLGDSIKGGQSLSEAFSLTEFAGLDNKVKDHVTVQYHFFNKNYDQCKEANLKIIQDSTSYVSTKSFAYSLVGDCLVAQDSLEKSIQFYEDFLKMTFEIKDPEQIKLSAQKLISVHEKLGNQDQANAYHKIYNEAINDTLSFSAEKYRELYNFEKDREAAFTKSKNLKRNSLLGLAILSLIGFLIYTLNKKSKSLVKAEDAFAKATTKKPVKKIAISDIETEKLKSAIHKLIEEKQYLSSDISRASVCKLNDIKSERYLSHYINDKHEKSFSNFINELRIEYAYKRIQDDSVFRSYKVEEIAKESGFGSKKSFERAFAAKYGLTPFKFISSVINS